MLEFRGYIHGLRIYVINKIENYLSDEKVKVGLEIGAGDGFQSRLLVKHLNKLIVSEYSAERLIQIPDNKIEYFIGDAENLEAHIKEREFDLIFSSHLLEHLPNANKTLNSCRDLISDDGYIIHVVPSKWYAFFRLLFWYPALCVRIFRKMNNKPLSVKLFEKTDSVVHNNLKREYKPRIKLFNFLFPRPHGISSGIFSEYISMKKKTWTKLMKANDLKIIEILNGSVYSGYGFGLTNSKKLLSKLGVASEYIYILKK
jgi:SAM-dependent methyltransferase